MVDKSTLKLKDRISGKHKKVFDRLKESPKNIKFKDLQGLIEALGGVNQGLRKSSHFAYILTNSTGDSRFINFAKEHPGNSVKNNYLRDCRRALVELEELENDET